MFQKLVGAAAAWAVASGHPVIAGFLTRYMGAGEAGYAKANGEIPNAYANGKFRPTHFTRDEPMNDAKAVQERYAIGRVAQTRCSLPCLR